jgi:DNA-binding NtrC family response regulator
MKDRVLIVEDELIIARDIRKTLERNGYKVAGPARSTEKALRFIEEFRPSLVLVDIFLKGNLTGIDLAGHLNKKSIPFIYISANSNQGVLEAAKTTNPYGFILKPFRERDLLVTIDIARYRHKNEKIMIFTDPLVSATDTHLISRKAAVHAPLIHPRSICQNIIGKSAPMLQVFNRIQQVAPFDTSVLISGESGTGKEDVAQYIVQQSNRYNKPYIKINCAAIPAELMESELFGYEKGAFTGATDRKAGKFELAAGGTILLDEIGEVAPELQAKLLRVLQEKEIQRIGGNTIVKSDVRILAATSRILEKEVGEGRFRLDLYYRLLVFHICMPPLRERKEDIPLLTDHFVKYYSNKTGKNISGVDPGIMEKLLEYNWPGNVRELQHIIERSVLLCNQETIREIELPVITPGIAPENMLTTHIKTLDEIEREYILAILKQCHFRISGEGGAAALLNIPPSTLSLKIKKLGIKISYE